MLIPKSQLEVLELYFTPDIVEEIVEQTNSYAEETMGTDAYASWKAITCEDIQAFMGFNFLMGINHQPSTEDYWKRIPFTIINLLPNEFQEIGFGIFQDISTLWIYFLSLSDAQQTTIN